ncbi:NUDIX domain-containing protein [Saccharopolyspora hattusasensis]|uniref:NUDIX domain-containing protein n=1 Tax=Saccharopolyspora hattusasensis TaxID=1128679 RepID=UPI003D97FEE2
MSLHDDTEPQPGTPAWEHRRAGNAEQVRAGKRLCSKILVRDEDGNVLIVNPTYKQGWDLPGGMGRLNEPPSATADREFREELGTDVTIPEPLQPLIIDWEAAHGPWDDQLVFVFVGVLTANQRAQLHIADPEIDAFEFMPVDTVLTKLHPDVADRLQRALAAASAGHAVYSETTTRS